MIDILNKFIANLKHENVIQTKDISDTYHTIGELYDHRCILFSIICNQNKEIAWKTLEHSDGTMFDGMFLVGINTPTGPATYHYNIEFWDMFLVKVLAKAPEWDGHTAYDVLDRLQTLN